MTVSVSDVIQLAALVLGGGGGATLIAKGTRLVVAVENLARELKAARGDITNVVTTVQDHETRLAHVEGHLQAKPP